MTDSTFQVSDLKELKDRYDELMSKVKAFIETTDYPSIKAHMIQYVNSCSVLESELITLKSEVSLTKVMANVDYKVNLKSAYNNSIRFDQIQKWQSDIVVHGESSVVDSKKVFDLLESMYTIMDEYKWLLKSSRELAANYYKFLSGEE